MRNAKGGSIVLMGSQSGFIAQPKFTPYNTSKGKKMLLLKRCELSF
jgi:short-subunit dehydrogenase